MSTNLKASEFETLERTLMDLVAKNGEGTILEISKSKQGIHLEINFDSKEVIK